MTPTPESAAAAIGRGQVITLLGLLGLAAVYLMALVLTPVEIRQGPAQKIFYIHAPAAWAGMLAFSMVGICGGLYLWLRDPRLDLFAEASAEVGLVFGFIVLTTGPIWGKPVWGAWWQWDARLTLTLFLVFLFVGYMALRSALPEPTQRARYSAVVGILGLLLVPFVHLSVYLFRTIHPQPVLLKPSAPSMPPEMLRTLLISVAVFTVIYIGFAMTRYGLGLMREARGAADAD